jgi:hypothetical protein
LIVGVIPFVVSFALAFAFREPAGYAALQGLGSFVIVSLCCSLLIGWASDEELASRQAWLVQELPKAERAWREQKERSLAQREVEQADRPTEVRPAETPVVRPRQTTKTCPFCAEVVQADARKCKHCGEMLDAAWEDENRPRQTVAHVRIGDTIIHVHGSNKSGGTAAVLEVIFGFFFNTFGIGHIYAGNVGFGLFLMFGYWLFLVVNVCLALFTCGVWGIVALVIVPACWFLLMITSPILASASVSEP